MNNVLGDIVQQKKKEIEKTPNYNLKESKYSFKNFRFLKILNENDFSIICECKRKSPSSGLLNTNYDIKKISREYEVAGASAVSVLTDEKFFGGSLDDLTTVVDNVNLPVLRKDFIINSKQILEAKFFGASIILLIVRILDLELLKELYGCANSLGLDSIFEVHTIEEAEIAIKCDAKIIGINSRDLDNFKIYPDNITNISKMIPKHIKKIGESGVHSKEDLDKFRNEVHGALIGSYFMQSIDIKDSFQKLF